MATQRQQQQRRIRDAQCAAQQTYREQRQAGWVRPDQISGGSGPAGPTGIIVAYHDGRRILTGVSQADGSIYWGHGLTLVPADTVCVPA